MNTFSPNVPYAHLTNFQFMAAYNLRMNQQVFDACRSLTDNELFEDRSAIFKSIGGTLNHILVGDLLWLARFRKLDNKAFPSLSALDQLPTPLTLDEILYSDFKQLKGIREALDGVIVQWVDHELMNDHLSSTLNYTNSKGKTFSKNVSSVLLHVFNHQTHHRGQVSTLLSQLGIDVGATDLILDIPDTLAE